MPTTPTFKLQWDQDGERLYETGVDRGVLYVMEGNSYGAGVAWNGLSGVTEKPSGADSNAVWADNIKYLNLIAAEDFGATLEAYTYPDEFAECDGQAAATAGVYIGQQTRKKFGFCYRTRLGNDTQGTDLGYKLHLIYNCSAAPSERSYQTINDSPEAISFSWEITTTPTPVAGHKPTACLTIDSTKVNSTNLADLEDILYGSGNTDARLPLPDEVISTLTKT